MRGWGVTSRVIMADEVEVRFNIPLKHCPFCASRGVGLYIGPLPHITCLACGADGPMIEGRADEIQHRQYQAILKWNMRA